MHTLAALFDDNSDARSALQQLTDAGISATDLSLIANNADNRWADHLSGDHTATARPHSPTIAGQTTGPGTTSTTLDDRNTDGLRDHETAAAPAAGTGASIGSILGGGAGLLAGIGALAIPGVGPIVAAGWLVATLTGAGVGAASGGLLGGLVGAGIDHKDANTYAEGIRRGGTLLTARLNETQVALAREIFQRNNAVNIEDRGSQYQSSGWKSFDEKADPFPTHELLGRRTGTSSFGTTGTGGTLPPGRDGIV